jgi:ParE toxin of type II toxin-antitoxin system, parDE
VKFLVRPAFWLDLERHHYWLTTHINEEIAEHWLKAVWSTAFFLREQPLIGRLRRDLNYPAVRSWLVSGFPRWTVFYGIQDESLVLYRVEGGETNLRGLVIG